MLTSSSIVVYASFSSPGLCFSTSLGSGKVQVKMATALPEGFRYETRYVVLRYLGLASQENIPLMRGTQSIEVVPLDPAAAENLKMKIEEEVKLLQDEINKAFASTGFECHTSPVFSPANPESSIEDCLARLGEKVFQELTEQVQGAVQNILAKPLEYELYKEQVNQLASRATGWNKVMLSLMVLRQILTSNREPSLKMLVELGVKYIEETDADFIIQQGGWGLKLQILGFKIKKPTCHKVQHRKDMILGKQLL
ncbi:bcl-2-like protein 13 isoform X3 [Narcine bancroftii]|uniref:bcl-2-like protein 13 isoform X3 n=1 Tax=Narcine bancroftii TaxID=1343680 RepID=UPI0038316CC0